MSSIFDFEDKSQSDVFPEPPDAQFPDDEDMEPGSKVKYKVKGDFAVQSFRGTADAGEPGRHVINLRVSVENNDDYDGAGEVAWWFDAESLEGQYGGISLKQIASLARLSVAMGLIDKAAFDGVAPIDCVPLIIAAAAKYQRASKYKFGGQLEFVKTKKQDGRVFMNHNLYINNCPTVEAPF